MIVCLLCQISTIKVNSHDLIRIIDVSGSDSNFCTCMLNENMLLTADLEKRIIQWKIEGDKYK